MSTFGGVGSEALTHCHEVSSTMLSRSHVPLPWITHATDDAIEIHLVGTNRLVFQDLGPSKLGRPQDLVAISKHLYTTTLCCPFK